MGRHSPNLSGAFYAETLQNLFKEWSLDVDGVFAGIDEVAEELEDWLHKRLSDLGLLGRVLSPLVDGIDVLRGAASGWRFRWVQVDALALDQWLGSAQPLVSQRRSDHLSLSAESSVHQCI